VGSVTPTVVAAEGYVRVEVNWQDFPHARMAWVYRTVAGVRTTLRGGKAVRLSNGIAVIHDHEMPYDVPVTYSSLVVLNYNGTFEEGVSEWTDTTNTGSIGVVSQNFDYYVVGEGVASAKVVRPPLGVAFAGTLRLSSEFIPAAAGTTYTVTGRLLVPDYWTGGIGVQVHWYNGASFLSSTGALNDLAPYPGFFGSYGFSATAPASTTQMKISAGMAGSPPDTQALYVDELFVTTAGTTATAADVVVPSDGAGWWVDPLHPATKIKLLTNLQSVQCVPEDGVGLVGVEAETFPADLDVQEVNDAVKPIGSWQRRKSGRSSMQVVMVTASDEDQVKALYASGAPLLLQLPAEYREPAAYQLHGDLQVQRLAQDMRLPWRLGGSSFTKVATPVGPAEGTWNTRYVDLDKYTTFGAAQSVGGLWDDFNRSASSSLGTSTNGRTYTTSGGSASDYNVNGSRAVITLGSTGVERTASVTNIGPNVDMIVYFVPTAVATGAQFEQKVRYRWASGSVFYETNVQYQTDGSITLYLVRNVTVLSGLAAALTYNANSVIGVHVQAIGSTIRHKIWDAAVSAEPNAWSFSTTDATFPGNATDSIVLAADRIASNTNTTLAVQIDNALATSTSQAPTWLNAVRGDLAV
jgi:hypothetical protein